MCVQSFFFMIHSKTINKVVQYLPGQKFNVHLDHLNSFNDLECKGRLATCLIYLNSSHDSIIPNTKSINPQSKALNSNCNDNNNNDINNINTNSNNNSDSDHCSIGTFTGGSTSFPEFNASISPRKGSAVFFWNTNERPGMDGYHSDMYLTADYKLRHSGDAVVSGQKWLCNRWIHPISFSNGAVRGLKD